MFLYLGSKLSLSFMDMKPLVHILIYIFMKSLISVLKNWDQTSNYYLNYEWT